VVGVPAPPDGVVPAPPAVVVGALGVVPVAAEVAVPPVVAVPVPEVVDVEVPEELELELEFDDAIAVPTAEVGTVNGGAPEVSGVPEPPPPQAVSPTVIVSTASAADRRVRLGARGMLTGGVRSRAAPCAYRNTGSR
jgi:hypothetical protein